MAKAKKRSRGKTAKANGSQDDSIDPDELLRLAATSVTEQLAIATDFKEVARLSESLASIAHQARQAAKGQVRAVSQIPLDRIVAYLKTLPEDSLDAVISELSGTRAEESLL